MIRPLIALLALLVMAPGCQTSSKFASMTFWRPQAEASTTPPEDPYSPAPVAGNELTLRSRQISPPPLPLPDQNPPASGFGDLRPIATPPNLFPML